MVFWAYDNDGREVWRDPAKYLHCKNRALINQKKRYWTNIEQSRKRVREYGRANKEMKSKCFKSWAEKNKEKIRNNRIKRQYGVDGEWYKETLERQRHVCAICGKPETQSDRCGIIRDLCIDHDHSTGKVRGLLCINCNVALGKFKDSISILENAIDYLNAQ